ncbi:AAA family ATPase [Bacillus sp. UNCCL81]|uniref:AAA family ATPase n=1 Tax=Bacillus sp. UNCCL81 TaxID=1502755 RepID=UPI0008E54F91|nr:AAA family ATPase [Bacillus sp. UNCCL81]SFC42029.1 AAA domain-containing protein, putative AbiEii toxin, Type IV TA system [Bacillus sp. UNCCL81]
MRFYVKDNFRTPVDAELPCVVLVTDKWNDNFRFETLFHFNYHDESGKHINIGRVKIYKKDVLITKHVIKKNFIKLGHEYCSLGQDLEFYENINKLGSALSKELLLAINDVAINEEIREKFKYDDGYVNSLLRFSEAEKALNEALQFFGENKEDNQFLFNFTTKLDYATSKHSIDFDFTEDEFLPYRINVLIGKNGTGKTQILSRLANSLSGYKQDQGTFSPSRPLFSKVITISYSAFDKFEKPHQDTKMMKMNRQSEKKHNSNWKENKSVFSYVYCGIQGKKGVYTIEELKNNLMNSYYRIVEKNRREQWRKILDQIIEDEHLSVLDEIECGNFDVNISSGQNIIISTITDVISNIEEESLLLFDEPELHLHPNAMSNLIRMFYVLLEEFKSYAIISTHSPLITQETPSKYVHVIKRIGDTPFVNKLDLECFGENLSNITNRTFGVSNTESNYKDWFKRMTEVMSYDDVLNKFNQNLSFNAMTYLNMVYKRKDSSKEND